MNRIGKGLPQAGMSQFIRHATWIILDKSGVRFIMGRLRAPGETC